MGKGSSLRNKEPDYPYVARDGNGKKLPYDPDRCPEGLDERIWHLALYFEQKMEASQVSCPGRPIIYVSLSKRIDNTGLSVLRAHARTCGIPWDTLVEEAIDVYFNTPSSILSIDNFTQYEVFQYCVQYVTDTLEREKLLSKGTWVVIPKGERQPSKRTEKQKETDRIKFKRYTEEEMAEKMKEFRSRGDSLST